MKAITDYESYYDIICFLKKITISLTHLEIPKIESSKCLHGRYSMAHTLLTKCMPMETLTS